MAVLVAAAVTACILSYCKSQEDRAEIFQPPHLPGIVEFSLFRC